MEQIIDSYTGTPNEMLPVSGNANGVDLYTFGQVFRGYPYAKSRLTKASFNIARVGTLTGNVTAVLYSLKPSVLEPTRYSVPDTILQTSTGIAASSISTTAGWVDFTFPGTYVLNPNAQYGIAIQYTNTNTTSSYIGVNDTFPAGTATEGYGVGTDNTGNLYLSDTDVLFRVYAIVDQTITVDSTFIEHSNPDATGPIGAAASIGNGGGIGSINGYGSGYAQVLANILSEILLTISNASHTNAVDMFNLSQAQSLALASALHDHAADSPTLSVAYTLALANAAHSLVSPELAMTDDYFLLVDPTLHSQIATSPVLSEIVQLITQNASHSLTSQSFNLTVSSLLGIPASAVHQLVSDIVALRQSTVIDADDSVLAVLSDIASAFNLTELGIEFGRFKQQYSGSGDLDNATTDSGNIKPFRTDTGLLVPVDMPETGIFKQKYKENGTLY